MESKLGVVLRQVRKTGLKSVILYKRTLMSHRSEILNTNYPLGILTDYTSIQTGFILVYCRHYNASQLQLSTNRFIYLFFDRRISYTTGANFKVGKPCSVPGGGTLDHPQVATTFPHTGEEEARMSLQTCYYGTQTN